MKKNVGAKLALYPTPLTVIGAMNKDKPTWTLVAHVGIIGHDRLLVSLAKAHAINEKIKETRSYPSTWYQRHFCQRQIM